MSGLSGSLGDDLWERIERRLGAVMKKIARQSTVIAKVYMAGPLFTAAERAWNAELCAYLRRNRCAVFLPQEVVGIYTKNSGMIFRQCLQGILWSDVVVACADGPDADSGTSFECGFALEKRPIVLYRTDFRRGGEPGSSIHVNTMLSESASSVLVSDDLDAGFIACLGSRIVMAVEGLKRRGFSPKFVESIEEYKGSS